MAKPTPPGPKLKALRAHGTIHSRANAVSDPLFQGHEFFDPRDLVQVKYEMVRRVQVEGQSVTQAAAAFGFSRLSFYQAQAALEHAGLMGLVPKKRGPHGAHKLTDEVVAFLHRARTEDPSLRWSDLVRLAWKTFRVRLHSRTIQRALAGREKKRR
jgi:transposase